MSTAKTPTLSKSRFSAGLQCLKRLYLEVYEPELAQEPDAGQQALFDMGNRVGALARGLFPGGRLVDAPYDRHDQGVAATEAALADPSVPALFEAAFSFQGIRIRCDILRRNSDGSLDLNEVKSSTRVKDEHIPDAAIQLYVLEGLGLRVRGVHLLHINSSYVYQGGEYDLQGLFQADDITSEAHAFLATEAPGNLAAMWDALAQGEAPDIETGPHCKQPYVCPFYDHCHAGLPEHYIGQLPRARENLLGGLRSAGILDIRDIPAGYPGLSAIQRRVWEGAHSGRPYVGGGLPRELAQVRPPVHFLDFETVNPALPLFPGTRPYQAVPFQWSLHTLEGGGRLRHRAFLHEGRNDPRQAFVQSLLQAAQDERPIVVYSAFEASRLKELADLLPQHAGGIAAVQERFVDLLKLLREHYYHPEQHGSYSLKVVAPALAPELAYDSLAIQEGNAAALAYQRLLLPETPEDERQQLRKELLDYCQRDTLVMVRILEVLGKTAGAALW